MDLPGIYVHGSLPGRLEFLHEEPLQCGGGDVVVGRIPHRFPLTEDYHLGGFVRYAQGGGHLL